MSPKSTSIYDFTLNDVNGNSVKLEQYRDSVFVIVNISEKTKNSAQILKSIYLVCSKYVGKNVNLLFFPCFQFGETENIGQLIDFVEQTCPGIGVIFEPIDVNGSKASQIYKFLKQSQPGVTRGLVMENFTIFITNRDGEPCHRINPGCSVEKLKEMLDTYLRRDGTISDRMIM